MSQPQTTVEPDDEDEIGALLTDMTPKKLAMEVLRLRRDCGEAYQAAGRMADALGWWQMPPDHPWHRPIEKLLDNLSAAADGDPREHDDLLPFVLGEVLK